MRSKVGQVLPVFEVVMRLLEEYEDEDERDMNVV